MIDKNSLTKYNPDLKDLFANRIRFSEPIQKVSVGFVIKKAELEDAVPLKKQASIMIGNVLRYLTNWGIKGVLFQDGEYFKYDVLDTFEFLHPKYQTEYLAFKMYLPCDLDLSKDTHCISFGRAPAHLRRLFFEEGGEIPEISYWDIHYTNKENYEGFNKLR
jgi:hypothetical protein